MHPRALPGLIAILAFTLAACSAADGLTAPPLPPSPNASDAPTPSPTVPPADHDLAMDWTRAFDLQLPNGWTVRDCEGDRTHVCVHDGNAMLGDIELLAGYPLTDTQASGEDRTVLTALAEDFLDHFAEDRSVGCPDFAFVPEEVRDATVGGQPGVRAAFSLINRDGQIVEQVVNHFTLQGDTYAIVNTDAYVEEGGCLGPSEYDPSFTPATLTSLEHYLDRLVADTPLLAAPPS